MGTPIRGSCRLDHGENIFSQQFKPRKGVSAKRRRALEQGQASGGTWEKLKVSKKSTSEFKKRKFAHTILINKKGGSENVSKIKWLEAYLDSNKSERKNLKA